MRGYQFKDNNYNSNNNKVTFPYTFKCRQCNEHHTAFAFNDDDIDYIVLLLEQNKKQILTSTIKKKTNSRKDKRLLRRELTLIERLLSTFNEIEEADEEEKDNKEDLV
jgi:hypothetical protein